MTITAMDRALLADAIARGDDARIGSVGCAQTGIESASVAADDARCRPARSAKCSCAARRSCASYWRNPDASAATLANGWLHTGDVGVARRRRLPHAQGPLEGPDHQRRLATSIRAKSRRRCSRIRDVADVAVIGRAASGMGRGGRRLRRRARRARPRRARSRRALDALCLARIARFKRPKAYVFVDDAAEEQHRQGAEDRDLRDSIFRALRLSNGDASRA